MTNQQFAQSLYRQADEIADIGLARGHWLPGEIEHIKELQDLAADVSRISNDDPTTRCDELDRVEQTYPHLN
jgi:hypothetical protein